MGIKKPAGDEPQAQERELATLIVFFRKQRQSIRAAHPKHGFTTIARCSGVELASAQIESKN
jgi:hypothetical protein